jgi:hypothetical protein
MSAFLYFSQQRGGSMENTTRYQVNEIPIIG